jgi:hypothetical protein
LTPQIAERALRVQGTTREFTHRPEALLADVPADDAASPGGASDDAGAGRACGGRR